MDRSPLDQVIYLAVSAADMTAIAAMNDPHLTNAEVTKKIVDRTIRWAVSQNLITINPPEEWPRFVSY